MEIYFPIAFGDSPQAHEKAFIDLLISDSRQGGRALTVHNGLTLAARERAARLAGGSPFSHTDENGVTPNEYVRLVGVRLPSDYGKKGNSVESLAAGTSNARVIFDALARSPSHSAHLFGRGWFAHQTHVGVGMAEGGEYGWYWVILIARVVND